MPAGDREPARYRQLLVVSIALIVGGLGLAIGIAQQFPGLLGAEGRLPEGEDATVAVLGLLAAAGLALLLGLIINAARSLVAREELPEHRYRGPSIIVLLLLALAAANLAAVAVAADVAALLGGGELSTLGTLLLLTVTQLGLLGVAGLYVLAPRALAGLRLLPRGGLWRSVGLGLVLSVPAWIGAQLIGYVAIRFLELFGQQPDAGIAEEALARADPFVLVVALVVVAPIAEEIFFRGVAYNAWLREYGPRRALYGSAILFALIHGSIFLVLPIAALGVALGLVYRHTGSLPAAMALHAGFNAITVALGLLVRYQVIELPIT